MKAKSRESLVSDFHSKYCGVLLFLIFSLTVGRLLEILDAYLNPPVQEEIVEIEQIAEAVVDAIAEAEAEAAEVEAETVANGHEATMAGAPSAAGGLSFRFMQESELESDPASFENGAEWVEKEEGSQEPAATIISVEVKEKFVSGNAAEVNIFNVL